ncbi:hypothetical protein RND81_09G089000 [Saponaria officinalis]|uniref:Seed biotin-containing protein SBP65 n=1 Tax=Saponaria officinalis TaxID=3572 RepID=A0AAW1IKD3_SAPOF
MASQQQRRDNTTHEREMQVEKDIVPKTATKFEDLAKATDSAAASAEKGSTVVAVGVSHTGGGGGRGGEVNRTDFEAVHEKVGGLKIGGKEAAEKEDKGGRSRFGVEERRTQEQHQIPSHAAHLVAEERYAQSKQHGAGTETEGKEQEKQETYTQSKPHGAGTETEGKQQEKQQTPSLEEISQYRQIAQQNSMEALQAAEERYAKAKEQAANAANAAKESAKHGLGAAATKTREAVGATTQYISEKTVPVTQTASEKAHQAKETLSSGTQVATEYASEKAVQAKDTTVSATKAVAGYVGEKAVVAKDVAIEKAALAKDVAVEKAAVAKDVAVETGKAAAGYAGKVAEGVKDQAVVAGWGVAHKTTEIAVEATKMAGGVVGKAKDVVATAAHKAVELAEVPVVIARDTAVGGGEKLADYTARKKIEAEKYKEENQAQYQQEGAHPTSGGGGIGEKIEGATETVKDTGRRLTEGLTGGSEESMTEESEAGVLGAIGETIVEIAQHTTNLVAGPPAEVRDTVKSKEM